MSLPTLLFVYGSLMQGGQYHQLLAGVRCLGAAWTLPRWHLLSLGPYPALVAGGSTSVRGELYELDAATLRRVDELEEHPHVYLRQPIRLVDGRLPDGYVLAARRAAGLPQIASGDWRPYLLRGGPGSDG